MLGPNRARDHAAAAKGNTVQLPNMPKLTDDKSRVKYMTEYEKYEPELRRHHLGTPETTVTVALRDVSAPFDRAVPAASEPTAAEREYEKQLKRHSKASRCPPHIAKVYQPAKHASSRAGTLARPRQLARASGETSRVAPPASPDALRSPDEAAKMAAAATVSVPCADEAAAAAPLAEKDTATCAPGRHAITAAAATTPARRLAGPLAPQPAPLSASVGNRRAATPPTSYVISPATRRANALSRGLEPDRTPAHSHRRAAQIQSLYASVPRRVPPVPPPPPPTAAAGASSFAHTTPAASARRAPTTPRDAETGSAGPHSPAPATPPLTARAVEEALRAAAPPPPVPALHTTPTEAAADAEAVGQEYVELLLVMMKPPPEHSDSFHVDLRGMDLSWLMEGKTRPAMWVSLPQWLEKVKTASAPASLSPTPTASLRKEEHDTRATTPSRVLPSTPRASEEDGGTLHRLPRLNSPRSILVLLRNGVGLYDLHPHHLPAEEEGILSQNLRVRETVRRYRHDRHAAQCAILGQQLLDDYAALAGQLPLQPFVEQVRRKMSHPDEVHERQLSQLPLPTFLKQRHVRQRKALETVKLRIARQLDLARSVREREVIAAERCRQAAADAAAAAAAKAKQEREESRLHQQRLAQQEQDRVQREAQSRAAMLQALQKAERRNAQRLDALERQLRQRQEERDKREAERLRRRHAQDAAQRAVETEMREKREAKEMLLERQRMEHEARIAEEQRVLLEKQEKARLARMSAMERAAEEEEQVRLAAEQRQAEVEGRLEAFYEQQREQQALRAAEEAVKQARRQQIYEQALQEEETIRAETLRKQREHEAAFQRIQQNRNMSMLVMRENEREDMAAKAFAIQRKRRLQEFEKLRVLAKLVEKRDTADFVARKRDAMLTQMLKDREKLQLERDKIKKQIAKIKM